jgi:hypothetical protein
MKIIDHTGAPITLEQIAKLPGPQEQSTMPGTYAVNGYPAKDGIAKRGFVTIGPEFSTGSEDSFVALNFHLGIEAAEKLLVDLPAAIAEARGDTI